MDKETLNQHFADHGLERVEFLEKSTYRLNIISDVTGASYPLYINTSAYEQGHTVVHFEEAAFKENETVPLHVHRSALDKLIELERLFLDSAPQSLEESNNSSMAQDFDEMKRLGKEMKNAKTGSELLEENLIPDPAQ
ncbi:hypothetical protein BGM26_16345 [Bacillus sp. FJAT-29790]|uniref:hypothetical protein n=1 Tax=Bacillus sp. FJAT-29790 TaxID=1895002 RepID=UPI001C250027|nr:hypothetical protein [Bacillus sp. FJAT-29790]MBU8880526.1 hypothetical protein [Bacillus sp. FJAT-29790]